MGVAADKLADIMREMDAKAAANATEQTHLATVTKIEDGTTFVRIDGSQVETPVSMLVNARLGDRVSVVIKNNVARITGNATSPPTDDQTAERALTAANEAEENAARAAEAAESAESSAADAANAATAAQGSASGAAANAALASAAASAAQSSASQAQADASTAATAAGNAASSASQAASDAASANRSANNALTQLSIVQDVAGTLSWISEHGTYTATTDTSVVEGRVYFELDDGEYAPVVEPSGNPSQQGWYVLDISDSQTDYIMAHLAVTSAGLWILPSGMGQAQTPQGAPGYKLLLASDGMTVYDASGAQVVKYGSSIELGGTRAFHLGTNDAYILFYDSNNDGTPDSIRIGGANVTLGSSKKLEDLLDELDGVRSDLDGLEIGGRNLYVTVDSVAGYINGSDGSISPAGSVTKERASDYIPVTPGESMVFQVWVTPATGSNHYLWMAYAFYDSNKAYLNARPSKTKGANTGTPQYDYYEFTVPANAAYIRVSARMYNDGLIKLERGNKPTDWTPAPEDVDEDIESAKATATRFITDITDGIFVAPEGQGPNDTQTPTGWRIKDALELIKSGISVFRVWLENGMAKVRIGESDGNHVSIDDDSIDMSHSGVEMAHFGYGDGNASSGTGTAPYYTLGVRRSTTAAYDPSSTYAVGDHVRYDGTEYVCITAIPTAEPWTAAHWTMAIGNYSVTEGFDATASGYCSHAEGRNTFARACSHAEGENTIASGLYSHAEGAYTTASEPCCHAEGYETTASRTYSHAEGYGTTASGQYSHAEGAFTTASGYISHAQNFGTVAAYSNQTAIGKYNDNQSSHAFEIGNGTNANNRSNAFAVDWDGNALIDGDVQDMSGALRYAPIAYGSLTGMASALTLSTSAQKLPLGGTFSGSGCSESSNGVMVEEAGTYMITGSAYLFGGYTANDIVHLTIHAGATEIADCLYRADGTNPYQTVVTAPVVVQLAANSVVTMHAYNQVAARGTINSRTMHGLTVLRIA